MKLHIRKMPLAYCSITLLLAGLFFSLTNPTRVSSIWLVIGFGLMVGVVYWFMGLVVFILGFYNKHIKAQRARLVRISTLIVAVLIALQSAGQLSLKDIAVLLPLIALGYLYFTYGRKPLGNR